MPVTSSQQSLFGYVLSPPGPADWGSAIDDVPVPTQGVDFAVQHQRWRSSVEDELNARLRRGDISVWYPLALPANQPVLPLIGGDPTVDWVESLAVAIDQAFACGERVVRIVDISGFGLGSALSQTLRARAPYRVLSSEVIAQSTSSDLLAGMDPSAAAAMIADVLRADESRAGRNDGARQIQLLQGIASCLEKVETLIGLADAARYALTLHDAEGSLTDHEKYALEDYRSRQLQNRRAKNTELDDLELLLRQLSSFDKVSSAERTGLKSQGTVTIRTASVSGGGVNHELAVDLLAARLAQELTVLDSGAAPMTVILGADRLSDSVLRTIRNESTRKRTRLLLFFERFAGSALDLIGASGASVGGFFRLGNNREAEAAAEFLGRQHRFELTSVSSGTSQSFNWGWSSTRGFDRSTSRSMNTGKLFASTLSTTVSRSTSDSTSGGGSAGHTSNTDYTRVYEYLFEPSTFQALPPGSLLMVDVATRSSSLVSCSSDVHSSDVTSKKFVMELATT